MFISNVYIIYTYIHIHIYIYIHHNTTLVIERIEIMLKLFCKHCLHLRKHKTCACTETRKQNDVSATL